MTPQTEAVMSRNLAIIQKRWFAAHCPPPRPWHSNPQVQAALASSPRLGPALNYKLS